MNTLTNDQLLEDLEKRVDAYHSQILDKKSEPESGAGPEASDEKELRDKASKQLRGYCRRDRENQRHSLNDTESYRLMIASYRVKEVG